MVELQTTWGWLVAAYLFLGGLGAGTMITISVIRLVSKDNFNSTIRFGAWASAVILGLGAFLLLLDVGVPLRAIVLFRSFVHMQSWMAIGAWLLFIGIAVSFIYALAATESTAEWISSRWQWFGKNIEKIQTVLSVIGIPLGIGIGMYTGFLLSVLQFRPLWHTWVLPILFTLSALDTGLALVMAYAVAKEKAPLLNRMLHYLEIAVVIVIPLEVIALIGFVFNGLNGSATAAQSAGLLVNGLLSPYFWILVVVLGLGVPLVVSVLGLARQTKGSNAAALPLIGAACCLVGGFSLRALVLLAGLPVPLASPNLLHILQGLTFLP